MDVTARRYFRDQFRNARYKALRNAEDFESLFHVLEMLGAFLTKNPNASGLGSYKNDLKKLVSKSPFINMLPNQYPAFHNSFDHLFRYIQYARNEAAHTGVYARNKTWFAIELGLIFETELNNMDSNITNYMVRDPLVANKWEPLSHIRKEMLINSYSYIPYQEGNKWKLISDYSLNNFLRELKNPRKGLVLNVEEGINKGLSLIDPSFIVTENKDVSTINLLDSKPVLIISKVDESRLLGVLTGFDLL